MTRTPFAALTALAGLLAALAIPAPALAAPQFGGGSGGRLDADLVWRDGAPAAGTTGYLGVVLDIDTRWHVQAGEGSGDEQPPYIATTIEVELPEGWTAGPVLWPAAHEFQLGSGKYAETLRGYDGVTLAAIAVTAPDSAGDGPHDVRVTVGYQACDDSVCEMPTSTEAAASFAAGAGAPSDDTIAALFDAVVPAGGEAPTDDPFADPAGLDAAPRMRAKLAWYEVRLIAGREATLAVVFDVERGWHVQAGLGSGDHQEPYIATSVELELPDGWTAGAPLWPEAHEFVLGEGEFSEALRGYEGRGAVVIPIDVPASAAVGDHAIAATIEYQACNDEVCEAPTEFRVTGKAVVIDEGDAVPALDADTTKLIEATLARAGAKPGTEPPGGPRSGADAAATAKALGKTIGKARWWVAFGFAALAMVWMIVRTMVVSQSVVARAIVIVVGLLVIYGGLSFVRGITSAQSASGNTIPWIEYTEAGFEQAVADGQRVFIKFTADWCANCQVNERLILASEDAVAALNDADVTAFKVDFTGPHPEGDKKKAELGGGGIPLIAVYRPGDAEPVAIRGQIASAQPVLDALQGNFGGDGEGRWFDFLNWGFSVEEDAVLLIFGIALIAGFFMNFTPCVLPVIPLKILSLQSHAKNPRRCFMLGLVFGAGIIAFYAVLGVFMAGLIKGIERLDWGAIFQHWYVTLPIGVVIGAMAVGLLGVFTIQLPQFLYMFNPQSDTVSGSFFMGMFTALLSTPCTGPLLGATVAWTAVQPSHIAFLTLLLMGVGMAFPYVLLTAKPSWLDRLPRAGAGSALVKEVMGLLLLAVAVWFVGTAVVALVV